MGFYQRHVFPRIVEFTLGKPKISEMRRELLSQAKGKTLEVGFGTGLNLPHYPKKLTSITAIDDSHGMSEWARKRLKKSRRPVTFARLNGEKLPFKDGSFDTVVFTFTLCSIENIKSALREARRVLKRGGKLLILEHGRAPEKTLQWFQDLLNPVQKFCGEGCHLNRDMPKLIGSVFPKTKLRTFYYEEFPKILGYFTMGSAQK